MLAPVGGEGGDRRRGRRALLLAQPHPPRAPRPRPPTPGPPPRRPWPAASRASTSGSTRYRREALLRFASLPRSPLEEAEGLEQLRALAPRHADPRRAGGRGGRRGGGHSRGPRARARAPRPREGKNRLTKYIFVTGGVVSSLGKGLASASIGALLEGHGFKVAMMKCDPYINVDPGTMSPYQHGEVYVTDDGAETDLDLGHYERFTHCETSKVSNITTGKIYGSVIAKERRGRLPRPHRAGDPAHHRRDQGRDPRGGQGRGRGDRRDRRHGRRHRGPALPRGGPPVPPGRGPRERDLRPPRPRALHRDRPRAQDQADAAQRARAARDRHLRRASCCAAPTASSPPTSRPSSRSSATCPRRRSSPPRTSRRSTRCRSCSPREGLDDDHPEAARPRAAPGRDMAAWEELVRPHQEPEGRGHDRDRRQVRHLRGLLQEPERGALPRRLRQRREGRAPLGRVGRARLGERRRASWAGSTGSWCPGGFGSRGTGGMVAAAEYARKTGTPYFGICYGFQWAVTEFARNVCGLAGANSTEVDPDAPAQDHLQAAGPPRGRGDGRHHAPRLLRLPAQAGLAGGARSTARPRSASATATATSSTRPT